MALSKHKLHERELAMRKIIHSKSQRSRKSGFSLIELLLAMIVLVIGLLGGMIVILTAIATNAQNRFDTAAVALAQSTMDRIIVLSTSSAAQTTDVTDCTGTTYTLNTTGGDNPGPGAALTNLGNTVNGTQAIDFTATPVTGYQMLYTLCAGNGVGNQQVYDVRWNIINTTTGNTAAQLVYVAAKNVNEAGNGLQGQSKFFSVPITLRGIRGN